jgi:hypothetical protein
VIEQPRVVLGFALVASLAVPAAAPAAVFRVGGGGAAPCTHATIAAAVAAAAANGPGLDQIYVVGSQTLASTIDVNNHSVDILGSFPDCVAAAPNPGRSLLTVGADPGFWLHGGTSTRTLTLQGFTVVRGTGGGRLIDVQGPANLFVIDSLLSSGVAVDGANVRMSGSVILFLDEATRLYNGNASGDGGAVHCSGGGTVVLLDGSIDSNTAASDGGGIYLDDCQLNLFAGTDAPLGCPPTPSVGRGILCNEAGSTGGGVFATNGAAIDLAGGALEPALIARNEADEGGGIYATGAGVTVEGDNAWITDNIGSFEGGGVYVRAGATLTLRSTEPDCRGQLCSLVARNFAAISGGVGGAIAADSGADVVVRQATFTGNSANVTGSVIFAEDAGTTVALEGLVVQANSGSLNDAYFETDDGAVLTLAFSTVDEAMGCCKGLFDTNNGSTVNLFSSILMAINDATGQGRIFDEPIAAGETRFADCILHREHVSTLPPPVDPPSHEAITSPDALFVARAAGDLRLRRGSQAQDFCDTFRYTPATTDIDREARGWDDPTVANSPFGTFDLGADEWRPLLLADHEEGDCSDWSSDTGGC